MIRRTEKRDTDALIDLATVCGLFEPDERDVIAEMLRSPDENDTWFTDDTGDGPTGVAFVAPEKMTRGTWNLYWIAVHPDHQRRGRGGALLHHVEEWLLERHQRILLVETAGVEEFEYVRTFYLNAGFEAEATVRDFYEKGVDKVIFRKELDSSVSGG